MKLSEIPLEKLKRSPWFHNVDPERLESIDDFAAWLEAILHNPCNVWEEDGEIFLIETRQLVARVSGLRIEVYPNEHPPPHFHVKAPDLNASFDIENCTLISGEISTRNLNKVKYWHAHAKSILVDAWNSTRPTDCNVGYFNET